MSPGERLEVKSWLGGACAWLALALAGAMPASAQEGPAPPAPPAATSPAAPATSTSTTTARPAPAPEREPASPSPEATPPQSTPASTSVAPASPTTEPAAAAPVTPAEPSPAQVRADALRTRALRIRQLMAGTLDPEVSLDDVLDIDLTDPALADRERWLELLADIDTAAEKPRHKRWRKPKPPPAEPRFDLTPEADLRAALHDLLHLPPDERAASFEAHRERRRALQAEQAAAERLAKTLDDLRTRRRHLQAFLDGRLDPNVDPRPLLSVGVEDLSSPELGARLHAFSELLATEPTAAATPTTEGAREGAGSATAATPGEAEPKAGASSPEDAEDTGEEAQPAQEPPPPPSPEAVAAERARIDALLARYLRLAPAARQALFDDHERRKHPPEEEEPIVEREQHQEAIEAADRAREHARVAAENRMKALEAARQAKSHSLRLLEEERARLHAVEEAQAHEEEQLSKERAALGADREEALAWTERVTTLAQKSIFDAPREADAERLYRGIDVVLDRLRDRLDRALHAIVSSPPRGAALGERLDDELLHEEHRGQLDELWNKLVRAEERLATLEAELRWDRAHELRDAIVTLNRARLEALSMSGPSHYRSETGTGPEGLAVARGELTQVALELRYHLLELPRNVAKWGETLQRSPGPVVWAFFKLVLILLVFRAWRRDANRWMTRLRRSARQRIVQSWGTRFIATFAWYVRRIHKPLDWLVLLWLLLGTTDILPELRFVRLVLAWVLTGSLVVLVLDAMASRQSHRGRRGGENAELRMRSLRLLGLTVVVLGLILSLTGEGVGKGAIYAWTVRLCWALVLPITLVLVYWWRSIVFDRLQAFGSSSRFARALATKREGLMSVPAATLGGAFLLVVGLSEWVRDQAYEFELMRRLLAYLVRSQVVRQSKAAEGRSGRPATLITDIQARHFRPEATPDRIVDYASEELAEVASFACEPSTTLTAVVGERGRGKSTFLRRLQKRIGDERVLVVTCPSGRPDDLLAALAEELGLEAPDSEESVAEALRSGKTMIVCVDDAQRLVRPTIEGLEHLDRIEDLARAAGGGVSWVLTFDAPAWTFIERAFGDRVSFDQVVMLPRWTEEQLGDVIRAATEKAKLDPSFDDLVGRRQLADIEEEDEERLEQSFYRILWDASDGNAAVALRYWRNSLYQDADGQVLVRMFDEPTAADVDASPLPVLFVLRSILQMDFANQEDLAAATNLTVGQVHNALRFAEARGFVEEVNGDIRVSWAWYRAVTRVLKRRRLLVM